MARKSNGKSKSKLKFKPGDSLFEAWERFCALQHKAGIKHDCRHCRQQLVMFAIGYMPAASSGYGALLQFIEMLHEVLKQVRDPDDIKDIMGMMRQAHRDVHKTLAKVHEQYDRVGLIVAADNAIRLIQEMVAAKCGDPTKN